MSSQKFCFIWVNKQRMGVAMKAKGLFRWYGAI